MGKNTENFDEINQLLDALGARIKTERALLKRLAEHVLGVSPYVTATISPMGHKETREGWIEVHRGRAYSSHNQLKGLEKLARETLATLEDQNDG